MSLQHIAPPSFDTSVAQCLPLVLGIKSKFRKMTCKALPGLAPATLQIHLAHCLLPLLHLHWPGSLRLSHAQTPFHLKSLLQVLYFPECFYPWFFAQLSLFFLPDLNWSINNSEKTAMITVVSWAVCCPSKEAVEVQTCECDLIWKQGLYRYNCVKMRSCWIRVLPKSSGWCPHKEGEIWRHRDTHRGNMAIWKQRQKLEATRS